MGLLEMPILETGVFLFVAALFWLWMDSIKARELAVQYAVEACMHDGVQLLDDTVCIDSLRFARNEDGKICLRRRYHFEFSDTGENRRQGWLALLGHQLESTHLYASLYLL